MSDAKCPHFGQCGGCNTQHLPYEVQLENKRRLLTNMIPFDDVKIFSSDPFEYRNRMDFIFHKTGIGFRVRGKWFKTVNVDHCHISNPELNKLADEVRSFFKNPDYFELKQKDGTFRYAVIRTPDDNSSISFVLNSQSFRISEAVEQIKEFAKTTTAKNILITYTPYNTDQSVSDDFFVVKGGEMLNETFMDKKFFFHVQGFFQNNSKLAEQMHKYCNDLLKKHDTKDSTLLDLYAGVGTFGIINADLFRSVLIVESSQQCIDAADLNIRENKIKNSAAQVLDAQYIKRLDFPDNLFVITDPPRSGMHPKTIEYFNKIKPRLILYISCNPKQLAKDLQKLNDYEIKSAALFDFFPQTPHFEVVYELILKQPELPL